MADKKISQLTLKTGNMAASDLVEITEGGNTTKSVNGTKIINMVTGGSVVTANTAKTGITSSQANAITANTSKVTNATHSGEVTGATALTIADNVVDEANLKVSNTPTNGYALTAQSGNTGGLTWAEISGGGGGDITGVTAGTGISGGGTSGTVTITNASPNATHTGEVTGATALTIADNIVDEANLKVSNSPTNGYFLSAQSGNTGGLTWAAASGGGGSGGAMTHVSTATVSGTSTQEVVVTGLDNTYKTYKLFAKFKQHSNSNNPIEVKLTDGGTKISSAVYNGARQYNGLGSAINGQTRIISSGNSANLSTLCQQFTLYMNGNNIEVVQLIESSIRDLTSSSPAIYAAQGTYSINSSYSASGNIDGFSFFASGTTLAAGSTFILYGLAE